MVAALGVGLEAATCEEEEEKVKGGERKLKAIYRFFFSKPIYHFSLTLEMNSHHVLYLAATQSPLWVPHLSESCLILRVIPPVSGSQVSLVSGTAFSKHRQTIYQNAQNFILILV